MKAIDFIRQNPIVKEWRCRVWTWKGEGWKDIPLQDIEMNKYPTAKLYFYCANENKGEVWITE